MSSLDVTKTFGKLHKDVMESIRGIESNISRAEFSALLYKLYLQDFVWNERKAIKRKIRNQQKRKFAWLFFRRRIKIHPIYGKSCKWFGWLRLGLWQGKSIYWKYKYKAPANSVTYAYKNDKMRILLLSTYVIMCLEDDFSSDKARSPFLLQEWSRQRKYYTTFKHSIMSAFSIYKKSNNLLE